MSFSKHQTSMIKGMLARGDKQHDIAAFFGVNGGRIAEVSSGNCEFPSAPVMHAKELPPAGPFTSPYKIIKIKEALNKLVKSTPDYDDSELRKHVVVELHAIIKMF